ncbi:MULTISPECIES: Ig-like domain-containing protein [unclassified Pseudomonas]|uniref:Ig-like domain-containing protein n=1 Tax=unclassified Pseudomonas TaxID=196821 RepID=UPI001F5C0678|nr:MULTISPECIES: Ig-like domain-containing protein [unclassified Pseudomonas]
MASPLIMSLEPRMLFDGAVAATVADAAQPESHPTADPTADAAKAPASADHPATGSNANATTGTSDSHDQADAPLAATPNAVPGQTVVFVDSRVKDAADLLKDVAPGTQVVQLDATRDGLQQIADYLDQHQGVSSVQIIAHGNAGDLWLGNSYLSADNVAERSAVLAEIGKDMNVGGDILIYACNTAQGERGISFVDSLAALTGRDIAASTNRTGIGGDWTLEIATGSIESVNALSSQAMAGYDWGLATITVQNLNDSGGGSLRDALASAQNGDIVTFKDTLSGSSVALNTRLEVTKNITLDGDLDNNGTADITLDGQYKTSVIKVDAGTTVVFDGLVITRGLSAGNGGNGGFAAADALGAGISNFGDLTLKNVSVTANAASGGGGGGGVLAPTVGGAGGGGGAVGGGTGGNGGIAGDGTGTYAGTSGTANHGGHGGSYGATMNMGGQGGSTTGGAGTTNTYGYSNGSAGGTASAGGLSIGGGGGGSGWDFTGGKGGSAAGGIYNASSGKLTIVGTSVITGNIGAGGGGGGGSMVGSGTELNGGEAGRGVGAIWNKGSVLITVANFAALNAANNAGGSGVGGLTTVSTASQGVSPGGIPGLFNDVGATSNTAYDPSPTATIVVTTPAQHIGTTSQVTITFSEAVSGFTLADLTAPHGVLSNLATSDGGKTWTATFTPDAGVIGTGHITLDNTGVTSVSLNLAGVGNTLSGNYSVDTVRPTATVTFTGPTLSTTATGTVNITFSEAVSNFSLADMTATNGVLSNLSTSDNIHWTATLTPVAGNASSGNIVTLNNTLYTDTAGNAGIGDSTSGSYVVDTVLPTATIVVANPSLSINDTSVVTITFSEAVTGLTTDDLAVANGTLSALTTLNGGLTWTGTLTATAGIKNTGNVITLNNSGVSDLAGNAGSGSTTSGQYSIDTQRPTASIVFGNNNLGIGQTTTVTITFNEAVSDLDLGDLAVSNGSLSNLATSDGGLTWTATFTPTPGIFSATNHITLDNSGVHDAVGNAGAGTTDSNNVRIDGVRPTATVEVASSSIKVGGTSLVTVTFSEAVTNFSNSDLTIANGTLSTLISSDGGITWTATLTPNGAVEDASNLITLNNTTYRDFSGNAGVGTTDSNNYAIDTLAPTASIVVADPQLTAGETTTVTITFSEAVTGLTLTDLSVANGSLSNLATSDGGTTWTATLTPDSNTASLSNVVSLANGAVADLAGNAGAAANSVNFTIDTVRPNATIVISDPALKIGETSLVTITFNQAVTGFSNADLTISNGTLSAVTSGDGGITWTATFTPSSNVADATNQIVLDNSGLQATVSGNVGVGSSVSNNYAVDTQRPTATVVVGTDHLGVGGSSVVTITFSEAVSGLDLGDLTVDNGTLSGLTTSDNITYTATLSPVGGINQGNNHVVLNTSGVIDAAGNEGGGAVSSNAYAIDSQAPTATIVFDQTTLLAGQTTVVTITFSEAVAGFDNSDLSVPNGTLSTVTSTDGGVTWTATFTPTSNINDTSNVISLGTSYTDLAGNTGGAANSGNFIIDTIRPTATIVVSPASLNAGSSSLVTITFSEAVTGLSNADLNVVNGTLSAVSSGDGGITWTATFTPGSNVTDTTNLITLNNSGVQSTSGNAGSGITDSNNYSIDTQRPTATISVANAHLGIGQTTTVTITFSEAVNGFDLSDLDVTNGVLSNLASADGGTTWTATLTPTVGVTDATNLVILDTSQVTDLAGNQGSGISISNNYGVDADLPSATIVVANPSLTAGQTTTVTITFSEAVTGFDLSDLSVANGTLSNLATSDSGKTWTATLTPTANLTDPSNFITLDNSSYTDLAGNAGTGFANSNNYSVTTVSLAGDPEFRVSEPVVLPDLPNVPLQPIIFGPPSGDLGSPLVMPPLFEQRTSGGGLPPIGSIFINNGALAPSFIAQVFSTDSGGDGNGSGFLGFGGGDGGVFGSSTLSSLFNQDSGTQSDSLNAFGKHSISSDATQGLRGVFGAPTLGQQLQQLKDNEQRQIQDLTYAFEQAGISEMQA